MLSHVFIIGPTGAGKSTLAHALGTALDAPVVSAGGWARALFPDKSGKALAEAAVQRLREDPDVALHWICERVGCAKGFAVVEGIRNPRDFALLCNPQVDCLIRLTVPAVAPASAWEARGLEALDVVEAFYEDTWRMRTRSLLRTGNRYVSGLAEPVTLDTLTSWVRDAPHP